jgi:hypothetical protein
MAKNIWTRDWVFNVTEPYLRRLKNRLGNIKIEETSAGFKFLNAENQSTEINIPTLYNSNGVLHEDRDVDLNGNKLQIKDSNDNHIEFEIETYGNDSYPVLRSIGSGQYGGGFAVGSNGVKNAVWYGTAGGFGIWSYVKNKDVMTYSENPDLYWVKSHLRVGAKLIDGNNSAGADGSVLTSTGTKTKWANPALDFANKIKIVSYNDVGVNFVDEVTTENLLSYLVGLDNTDDYLNSFITIQDIPMAVSTLDGNVYEGKPLFFFRKTDDTYEILEVYKKQTRKDLGPIEYSANIKSDNYTNKMLFHTVGDSHLDTEAINIETITDNDGYMGFKTNKDGFINIAITEGFILRKTGRYAVIKIIPESGISRDDYLDTFGVKYNGEKDLFTRWIQVPIDSWFSEEIEFRLFVKANKGFIFKVEFYEENLTLIDEATIIADNIMVDGGQFGRIDIRGV